MSKFTLFDGNNTNLKDLFTLKISLDLHGMVCVQSCNSLEDKLVNLFNTTQSIPELSRILIYPERDQRSGDLTRIRCFAYFEADSKDPNANIILIGGPYNKSGNSSDGEKIHLYDYASGYTAKGKYKTSEHFRNTFIPLAEDVSNNKLRIQQTKEPIVAVIELDFMSVLALALDIDEDKPYNFTIVDVIPGKTRNGGYDDATIVIMKYIDSSNMRRKRKSRNGKRINWNAVEQETLGRINGGRQ